MLIILLENFGKSSMPTSVGQAKINSNA